MQRRSFVIGVISSSIASTYSTIARADLWSLVTKDEFDHELSYRSLDPPRPKTTVRGPIISVLQPDQSKPIRPPITIRIAFRAQAGAKINVKSFRAMYGSTNFDITQRLLDHAKLDESGLSANNALLPAGQHTISLAIADSFQRIGMFTARFTVV